MGHCAWPCPALPFFLLAAFRYSSSLTDWAQEEGVGVPAPLLCCTRRVKSCHPRCVPALVPARNSGSGQAWEVPVPLPLSHLHHLHVLRSSAATRPCQPRSRRDPAPLKTLLFILVPLSAEEEPRAALGHLSPGRQAGRPGPRVPGGAGAAQDSRLPPPAVGAAPFPPQPCAGLCVLRAWLAGAAHPCPRPCWPGRAQGPARCCVQHCGSHLIWHRPLSRAGGE